MRASDVKIIAGRLEELIQSALAAVAFIRDDKDKVWSRTLRGTQPMSPTDTRRQALPEIRRAQNGPTARSPTICWRRLPRCTATAAPLLLTRLSEHLVVRTAPLGRYVTLAREAGLLPETTQGKVSK